MHKHYTKIRIVFVAAILFAGGFLVGRSTVPAFQHVVGVSGITTPDDITADFEPFWEVWHLIDERFVTTNESHDPQERVWGAISGLTASLDDPYTEFLPPEDTELFEEELSGRFGGVGMEIDVRDDLVTVIAPLYGTPAERAGILSGDKIIAIDGESALDLSIYEAVEKIRGEIGTSVTLTLLREETPEPFDISITRDAINVPTIETEIRDDGIFVLNLFNFGETSPHFFQEGLQEFVESGSQKLILDLRGNPGGFLEAALDITSWFLPNGTPIVSERFDTTSEEDKIIHRSKGYNVLNDDVEMIVLVNQGSASASEIVAGALQEHGVAQIIGAKTFGKGSVQELIDITGDTSLKLTIARWYTPEGKSISEGGLTPDIEVELTLEDIQAGSDPQLEKAIEMLRS